MKKTADCRKIAKFLDRVLEPGKVDDYAANGLQVEGRGEVTKAAFAVDFSVEAVQRAAKAGAQMLVVHHGLIWGGLKDLTGPAYRRVKALMDHGMALYASHLPLDLHAQVGNNAGIARMLGMKKIKSFAFYHGQDIGWWGTFPEARKVEDLGRELEKRLETKVTLYQFGPKKIKTAGVVSGAGAESLPEAIEKGFDLLITGEPRQSSYHVAREGRINLMYAGHYATETVGIKSLMPLVKKEFGIETRFLDIPTGI